MVLCVTGPPERMKMRRHRVFLLCTVGLCVISFLHYYKALHYVSLLKELSAPYPNIKSFIMVTGFFWREGGATPLTSAASSSDFAASQEDGPPPALRPSDTKPRIVGAIGPGGGGGRGGGVEMRLREEPAAPQPWGQPEEEPRHRDTDPNEEREGEDLHFKPWYPSHPAHPVRPYAPEEKASAGIDDQVVPSKAPSPDPLETLGDIHTRTHQLQDDPTSYFVRTKAGALCFRQGTEVATPRDDAARPGWPTVTGTGVGSRAGSPGQRKPLAVLNQSHQQPLHPSSSGTSMPPKAKSRGRGGKRLVKCVCRPGWHGPYCGVPTMVYHSNLPTKERLTPRERPRRVINAINVNHEFDLLHVRFHELTQAVDLFLVCESNFTAYGERRPLRFLHLLLNGTYDYVRHKILYVFLDHFPDGGRQDGWIADDYLRTYLTRDGMARVTGSRPDDVFVINDADEIPAREGLLFLKLFDGWTEPLAIHMRKSLYGFFWKQLGSLEVVSGCTVGMLRDVYDADGIRLRRREYYTMPGFRKYENDTGHILVQWAVGSPFHFAGWHCSWCFSPEGIHFKLISAQNGDFPRWGDYEDKRDLNYIRDLIRTGGWFDGSVQEYPPSDPKEHMYAPKYMLENYEKYLYLLENPYVKHDKMIEE
ncbi:beta-1,4-mannosyl-glycoprotein 4-beta-N-acetylglucosaminyltransferase isoform 1-T1 [Salvelinus alpinus]